MRLGASDLSRAGVLDEPHGDGVAGGSACGDQVRLQLRFAADGTIETVRFGVLGCTAASAAAAWCAERAEGGGLLDAARLSLADCVAEREVPSERHACAAVALDALAEALADGLASLPEVPAGPRTAVAMSGGVDSAVALHRVLARGDEAVGITLRLWIDPAAPDAARACCSPEAVRRARATCHELGVPHLTLDARDGFRRTVVQPFLDEYQAGRTPNPCTTCNGDFRIALLADTATRLGAARLATGHYARLVPDREGALVGRGADPAKDQSAMLARVPPALLGRLEFPLADAHKHDVREEASVAGLAAATAAESQDVCFLGGGDLRGFLERHGVDLRPGEIHDADGAVLGRHEGAVSFTVGQRRGLGVAAAEPLYVRSVDAGAGIVSITPLARLARREVDLVDARLYRPVTRVNARLRIHMAEVGARVDPSDDGLHLTLDEAVFAVAPGQVAVLYDDDGVVVGVGTIAGDREGAPA
ncbi:MAG TPA: tRNA 2-thiouridine(34) synthase MnmA [Gaiellales bacterium]|jgi:tRNA-specific 2-thiouridylase